MLKCQETFMKLWEVLYIKISFCCNNKSYKLEQSLVDLLHENNLRIYDWQEIVEMGLTVNYLLKIVRNSTNHVKCDGNIVMLMHCSAINKNTVSALPQIIKYYKENGYTLK